MKNPWPIQKLFLTIAALLAFQGEAEAAFDPSGFRHRGTITFGGYTQPEVLSNFPVLIRLGPGVSGFSYAQLSPNGADLRFVSGGTELSYEIDTWNPSGDSYIWVKIPALAAGGTEIKIYWGNPSAVRPAYTTDGSTWSNGFLGVWHLSEPHARNSVNDISGVAHGNLSTNGIIGNAQFFALPPVNTSYIDVGNLKATNYTLSAWTRNTYSSADKIVFRKADSIKWEQWNVDYNVNQEVISPSGNNYFQAGGNLDLNEPDWTHEVVAYDSATGTGYAYMSGVAAKGYPLVKTPMVPNANDNICTIGTLSGRSYYGSIDELQFSSVVRSAAWVKASYQNQSSPASFYSIAVDPVLTMLAGGPDGALTLTWPVGEWVLQKTSQSTIGWTTNGIPAPAIFNGMNNVTVFMSEQSAFYRLFLPAKDFALGLATNNLTVGTRDFGSTTVSILPFSGFTNLVGLTLSGVPAGVTPQLSPPNTAKTTGLSFDVSATAIPGNSIITITGTSGSLVRTTNLTLTITSTPTGARYYWPTYSPNLNYDFRSEYPNFSAPTNILDDCPQVVETIASGWWCFRYGPNKNPVVTSNAWNPMLVRYNSEFQYFRDVMGWPPDKRAKRGYFSSVYLFGSGLCTDSASNTDTGGWQSSISYKGENWPMVLLSYIPVWSFDPAYPNGDTGYQQGGSIHEGVHSVLADMPGCRNAGWFHEGGNNWLQSAAAANKTGNFNSLGWLSAGAMVAPFMPVECYSGWLQDGSFGGPGAEGVNVYSNGVQLCTWRNLLGGTQYGECFPTFLGEIVSQGSVAWVWQYCPTRVLEGLANSNGGLGPNQTRRLIKEFRGRQAMCDFGRWNRAYTNLLNGNWKADIHPEYNPIWSNAAPWTASCYVWTTNNSGTLTPEQRTLPAWSGANQIPLTVASGATAVSVNFQPIGANMSCQLVYRDTNGSVVYSYPVSSGVCTLNLARGAGTVKNNVVIAVICNTDYVYTGDSIRSLKFDYRLTIGTGLSGTADAYKKWWSLGTP